MAVLDTTILIDLLRRRPVARKRRAEDLVRAFLDAGELLMTTRLNVAELHVGIELSSNSLRESEAMERMLRPFQVLEFDDASARAYGRIQASLRRAGRPIGDMDALIAAIALCHAQRVVTRNPRHFVGVPGLAVQAVV